MSDVMKATPGPWTLIGKQGTAIWAGDEIIASVNGSRAFHRIARANAVLMASAPDLQAALEDMLYMAEELVADGHIDSAGSECSFMETEEFCSRHCESCGCIAAKVATARAAITRATP